MTYLVYYVLCIFSPIIILGGMGLTIKAIVDIAENLAHERQRRLPQRRTMVEGIEAINASLCGAKNRK